MMRNINGKVYILRVKRDYLKRYLVIISLVFIIFDSLYSILFIIQTNLTLLADFKFFKVRIKFLNSDHTSHR